MELISDKSNAFVKLCDDVKVMMQPVFRDKIMREMAFLSLLIPSNNRYYNRLKMDIRKFYTNEYTMDIIGENWYHAKIIGGLNRQRQMYDEDSCFRLRTSDYEKLESPIQRSGYYNDVFGIYTSECKKRKGYY